MVAVNSPDGGQHEHTKSFCHFFLFFFGEDGKEESILVSELLGIFTTPIAAKPRYLDYRQLTPVCLV